jgi:hypothetical protein
MSEPLTKKTVTHFFLPRSVIHAYPRPQALSQEHRSIYLE